MRKHSQQVEEGHGEGKGERGVGNP